MSSVTQTQTITVAKAKARGTVTRYEQRLPGFRPLVTLTIECDGWLARGELVAGKAPQVWRCQDPDGLSAHWDAAELAEEHPKLAALVSAALAM